ncbi:UNVERIFIED_CONTAM: Stemmadenine O-acetyltransferase [Sesamum radiatum]|uniref:Stemmadenine O-acetyltransferase n=1 Tax=Sesamum radiatum TaxID=300843 RepID=A0AAW2JT47_SESRA
MPFVYFYEADAKFSSPEKSNHLKKSLSQVLSMFYPLAGRLVDDLFVDCNDQGAPYVEAVANCSLSRVITNPVMKNMGKFLPYKLDDVQNLVMAVQVTYFQCGGTAVGLIISHKVGDALSFLLLANTWSAIVRNENYDDVPCPKFEGAKIFPPRDTAGFKLPSTSGTVKEELVTKIFTFPASKISALQESNLRPLLDPPLSEYHFGNISRLAIAMPSVGVDGGSELLQKVREAIRAVNGEYIAQLRQGDKHLNSLKERMAWANKGKLVTFNFTSLCKFPLYKADFGWGKPVWVVTLTGLENKNLIAFTDTARGDGIEARINLRKEDMEKFEADLELQEFLSEPKTFGIHN